MNTELTELINKYDKYVLKFSKNTKTKHDLDKLEKTRRTLYTKGEEIIHSLGLSYSDQCKMEIELDDSLENVDDKYFSYFNQTIK